MKRILSLATALLLALALAACGGGASASGAASSGAASAGSAAGEDRLTIAMSMNVLDEFQSYWFEHFKAAAEAAGAEVISTNAEGVVDKQITDVESLIQLKPDVILIRSLDPDGLVPAFEACVAAGIPVVDDEYGINFENCVHLTSSQIIPGQLQGQWCAEFLDANPDVNFKVGYLWGAQTQQVTKDRFQGWNDVLKDDYADRYEIVAEGVTNWSATESMDIVEDWMQAFPDINLIVAQGDELAVAATNVVSAAGRTGEIYVLGVDGSENARVHIRDGKLTGTAYSDAPTIAKNVAGIAIQVAKGEVNAPSDVDVSDGARSFITAENIDEVLASYGVEE